MSPGFSPCSRRVALRRLALSSLVQGETALHAAEKKEEELTFFVTADPQIHLDQWGTAQDFYSGCRLD